MKYTELGKTGLHVSEIGFGAWAIGGQAWGNDITDKNAMAALQEAWQQGINLFDSAKKPSSLPKAVRTTA